MKDLEETEVSLGPDTYAGTPSQCPVCKEWQVDIVFTVPENDGKSIGATFKAASQALLLSAAAFTLWMEHMGAHHPDEPLVEGWGKGFGSSSD